MKKYILTLALAIVSSVWIMGEALCLSPIPEAMYVPFINSGGKLLMVDLPCGEEPCAPCVTIALQTNTNLYYLTTDNAKILAQLEAIEAQWHDSLTASVSGTYYISEDIDHNYNYYILVSTIELCGDFIDITKPTTDTIPLYARDDSGSSTVDPVDPNQIYATLTGDMLTVHNNTGAQVTFTLNNTSVNNVAARVRKNTEPVSFTESVSVELLEDGIYEILLTSEEWNYTVFGTVNYIHSATDIVKEETTTTKKVLRGTQILIEREGKTYTLIGQEIK